MLEKQLKFPRNSNTALQHYLPYTFLSPLLIYSFIFRFVKQGYTKTLPSEHPGHLAQLKVLPEKCHITVRLVTTSI